MTKADEMLKECGYTLDPKNTINIEYVKSDDFYDYLCFTRSKKVVLGFMSANTKLILAINEKIKELGWIENVETSS